MRTTVIITLLEMYMVHVQVNERERSSFINNNYYLLVYLGHDGHVIFYEGYLHICAIEVLIKFIMQDFFWPLFFSDLPNQNLLDYTVTACSEYATF